MLRPAPLPAPLIHHSDPLLPLDRAAKSLQDTIQSLLDAQSEGLLAGITSSNGQDDLSSNGSLTPTPSMSSATTTRKPATVPIRQPPKKRISLRGARRGLSRSMYDFVALKQEEGRIVDLQIREREGALDRVESFTTKQGALQSQIASITSESGAQSATSLRTEANELDVEIRVLENKLFEMKARHRHLIDQAQQLESSVQSKLSSYNASLDLIDKDIKRFLARPPILQPSSTSTHSSTDDGTIPQSFYSLNPKRRTLDMASEQWRDEREALKRRKEAIQHEQHALEEGGKTWREVVTEIQTFERHLKSQMQSLSLDSISQLDRDEGMTKVLSSMDQTVQLLERRLHEAEAKDWKLLLCCIGAELEAFQEGREILLDASGLAVDENPAPTGLVDIEHNDPPIPSPESPDAAFLRQPEPESETETHPSYSPNPTYPDDHRSANVVLPTPQPSRFTFPNDNAATQNLDPDLPPNLPRTARLDSRSESEDDNDDPGPDFLISHT